MTKVTVYCGTQFLLMYHVYFFIEICIYFIVSLNSLQHHLFHFVQHDFLL